MFLSPWEMNSRFRSKVRDRCFSSLVPAAAMHIGVHLHNHLHGHKARLQGSPAPNFLRKKPWGRGWMGTNWKTMVTGTRRREPQLERRVGSDHQIQAPVRYDAPRSIRNTPRATGPSIFCSVFSISLIVTANFGSCLMIASQEAWNSE